MNELHSLDDTEHTGPVDTLTEDITYSTPEVCELTGFTYRQLDYWVRIGILEPLVPAHGSGTRRRWSPEQVTDLQTLARVYAALTAPDATVLLTDILAHLHDGCIRRGTVTVSWNP